MEDGHPTTHAVSQEQRPMHPLLEMLTGGDGRPLGKSHEVVVMVSKEPGLFDVLFSGLFADDPVVRMRSADAGAIAVLEVGASSDYRRADRLHE